MTKKNLRKVKNPKWVGAIHEVIDIHHLRQENYYDLKIEHNRDGKFIEPKRNLRILSKMGIYCRKKSKNRNRS